MTEQRPVDTMPMPLKLRVEDYLLLDGAGAFANYAKTELLDGEIVFVNAQHRPHALLKMDLYDALRDALRAAGASLRPLVEASILLPDSSVPEPDIVCTSEPGGEGPVPLATVALVVEVADTTLDSDLGRKARIYATAQIPEYWVADVDGRMIHRMWRPVDGSYREVAKLPLDGPLAIATLGIAIAVR